MQTNKFKSASSSSLSSHKKSAPKGELEKLDNSRRPFTRVNFLLMAGCLLLIVVGFLLMAGGGSSIEGGFNPDIFSARRIVVGPTIAFLGFLLMAFAIIYTPRSQRKGSGNSASEANGESND